jgi:8-hydroxy-5-deazaflavin:NADPH oxidoreductase
MKIAVLETVVIDHAIGIMLAQAGNHVTMGSRTANHESASKGATPLGERAQTATFADAPLPSAGAENLRGKILIHVGNPLTFPKAWHPR